MLAQLQKSHAQSIARVSVAVSECAGDGLVLGRGFYISNMICCAHPSDVQQERPNKIDWVLFQNMRLEKSEPLGVSLYLHPLICEPFSFRFLLILRHF